MRLRRQSEGASSAPCHSVPRPSEFVAGGRPVTFAVVEGIPRLHTTPLAKVVVECPRVVVELDDEEKKRFRLLFEPYQAVRVVTEDCFYPPEGLTVVPNTVVEVKESPWVQELRENLSHVDHTATFLEKARHYLLPLQDDFLEVVAWKVSYEPF